VSARPPQREGLSKGEWVRRARDLLRSGPPASVRDLVHAAVMPNNQATRIASFDGGFDGAPGIERLPLA
jgi:predicted nucleic acid-binding protein